MAAMRVLHYIPGGRLLLRCSTRRHPSLVRRCSASVPDPVGLAAGFDKDAEVYEEMASLGFGFVEVGTITPLAQPGNQTEAVPLPMDHALINRGFQQPAWRAPYTSCTAAAASTTGGIRSCWREPRQNTLTPNEKARPTTCACSQPVRIRQLLRHQRELPERANLSLPPNKEHLKLLEGLIDSPRTEPLPPDPAENFARPEQRTDRRNDQCWSKTG
ncbi:MAG: hypothetical protein ACLS37_13130 [Alistipes sp.]